jgi:hypothetical protein
LKRLKIEKIKTGISQCNDAKSDRLPQVICPLKENTISGILIEFEEISRRCKKFFENKNNKKLENVDDLLKELDKFIRLFCEGYTLKKIFELSYYKSIENGEISPNSKLFYDMDFIERRCHTKEGER